RESPASRSLLSRGSGGGWQRQWFAWSAPALPRELLCSFRHWSGRAQHRSGLPRTRGLTLPSRGRPQAGFAHIRPPLMSNVERPLFGGLLGVSSARYGSRPVTRSGVSPIGPLRALGRLRDLVRALCRRSLGRLEDVRQIGRRPLSGP